MPDAYELARSITHARVEVRTPSLAPKHRQERDFVLRGEDVPGWHERLVTLITETRINGVVTLAEHMNMSLDGDREGLQRVLDAEQGSYDRVEGRTHSTLILCGDDGYRYAFDIDFQYAPGHWRELHELVVAHGTRRELPAGGLAMSERVRAPNARTKTTSPDD